MLADDPGLSSTGQIIDPGTFEASFNYNTSTSGDYFKDILQLGDIALPWTFGLGLGPDQALGILVLGGGQNKTKLNTSTAPAALAEAGHISSSGFSLWSDYSGLSALNDGNGTIVFGGLDREQVVGPLSSMPALPYIQRTGLASAYTGIPLTSLSVGSPSGSDVVPFVTDPLWMDIRARFSFISLPRDTFRQIVDILEVRKPDTDTNYTAPWIPCATAEVNGYLSFGFWGPSGPVLNVSMSVLVQPLKTHASAPGFKADYGSRANPTATRAFRVGLGVGLGLGVPLVITMCILIWTRVLKKHFPLCCGIGSSRPKLAERELECDAYHPTELHDAQREAKELEGDQQHPVEFEYVERKREVVVFEECTGSSED